jgi:hypothetical protein
MKPRQWAANILLAIDQMANAVIRGDPDETISSRAGKSARQGKRWACILCRLLDRIDPDHCEKAIEADRGKRV